jgi:DNA-binding ferritin-like protein
MYNLFDLHVALRLYHSNLLNLHWNSHGMDFNDSHKSITTEYYELCDKYIDITAEMLARLNVYAPNYIEVVQYISKSSENFHVVDSKKLYTREEIVSLIDTMLESILSFIAKSLNDEEIKDNITNVGIKSDLEAMYSEFDLQYRYINKRRMV